ncbi:MAG TPA: hypothetical protein VHG09_07855 [Longimicrobiales bacterium]|nr:hypothetical protein [Longimicrobiales bacterium]
MPLADSPAYPESEIEALISALRGVLASRVTLSDLGQIEEIHVLAAEQLHPKQIVRNIESALSAGLGIAVDRRMISVAQVRGDDQEAYVPDDASAPQLTQEPPHDAGRTHDEKIAVRYVFVGYDARTQPDLEAACRVTIRRGSEVISGSGTGPSTRLGRAQAAARAVFSAISAARQDQTLGLEGVTLVESHGRDFVLVAANAASGRESLPLTGAASLHRSPEEAAILASLQATNRWSAIDG